MSLEKINDRMNQLIDMGGKVLLTEHSSDHVDYALFYQWEAGSLSFLKNVFGNESTHFQLFQEKCNDSYYNTTRGLSVLKAAKEDIEGGYLIKLETLVAADIFTDFLEMSEHLVEQGYMHPAASLIGAVLEDGLRKIANNNSVKLKNEENISSLNHKIAAAQIYNRLTQKKVQVWNDIRNNADHGKFSEYKLDDVKEMLNGVTAFLEQYL